MAKSSRASGKKISVTVSHVSRTSKPGTLVVSNPLQPSEIEWLKRQSKHANTVSRLLTSGKR